MPKVLLTGAAGGIGVATARRLWEKGFQLVLTDLSLGTLERAFPEVPSGSSRELLDVQSLENWQEIAERHPDTEIVIQLAGVMRVGKFIEQPLDVWHLQQGVNLTGLVYGAWVFGRRFAERGHGHLIHVASLAGIAPVPGITAYTATKFGVRGFSLALDLELRPHGVPVTVICPGPVATPLIWNELPKPESVYTLAAGGLLKPETVARAIERAIRYRPREIALPAYKAWAARLVGAFPRLLPWAVRLFTKGAARRRAKFLRAHPMPSPSMT
ncbi:MAG: SDR family NAD(P)-dependent oxidoreductase [Bacteroidia bacterium]|nr:SDR family NAD(P)-dependent oxidoreductase [Bacteroidia bacterium]MDW8089510.1 SDR family NAD(P)-dependent oxidoreductase [Bacteroidia bacterium]